MRITRLREIPCKHRQDGESFPERGTATRYRDDKSFQAIQEISRLDGETEFLANSYAGLGCAFNAVAQLTKFGSPVVAPGT